MSTVATFIIMRVITSDMCLQEGLIMDNLALNYHFHINLCVSDAASHCSKKNRSLEKFIIFKVQGFEPFKIYLIFIYISFLKILT